MSNEARIQCSKDNAEELYKRFQRDGAIIIPDAFDEAAMQVIEDAYNWNLNNPGPVAQRLYPEEGGVFIQSQEDSSQKPAFQRMYRETPIADIAKRIYGTDDIWHYEDQLFFKEGANSPIRRTPWHQDTVYHPIDGPRTMVMWIPLDDISAETALEVIPGTHKGTLYNGTSFAPDDDTAPFYDDAAKLQRMPDIQAERDKWDIVTCVMKRGDALIFHTSTLHGGGGTPPGGRRRSLSLRIVADDVVRTVRPQPRSDTVARNNYSEQDDVEVRTRLHALAPGEPIYKAGLTKL
ncbi:MAG: phytanoyl-CoA dioxygenase family protein [Sphingomonadaceae bacterium]